MSNMRKGRPQGGAMGAADPKALGRAVKKLFEYYPVMAPLTMFCILFSSVVSSIPSLFVQNVLSVIEKWYLSGDWASAKAEIIPYAACGAVCALADIHDGLYPAHGIHDPGLP